MGGIGFKLEAKYRISQLRYFSIPSVPGRQQLKLNHGCFL